MIGAFFKGFSDGVTEDFAYIRKRIEEQAKEARRMRRVLAERREKADQLRLKINRASATTGVRKEIMFDAFKNGQLDKYLNLLEKSRALAASQGRSLSPEVLESWYQVPNEMTQTGDIDMEIDQIFGLLERSVSESETLDDFGASEMLWSAIGGNISRQVDRGLANYQIGDRTALDLLNLPGMSVPEPTGGRVSDQAYQDQFNLEMDARRAGRIGGSGDEFDPWDSDIRLWARMTSEGLGESLADELTSRFSEAGLGLRSDYFREVRPMESSYLLDVAYEAARRAKEAGTRPPSVREIVDSIDSDYDPDNNIITIRPPGVDPIRFTPSGVSVPEPETPETPSTPVPGITSPPAAR